ncbi:MAG TPA: hypothetical protein VGP62_19630 [Bryobacteraceae bacterium]|nr:hypothetical protein [Bryobacteraceae bacterium]
MKIGRGVIRTQSVDAPGPHLVRLAERGAPADRIQQTIETLGVEIIPCDAAMA